RGDLLGDRRQLEGGGRICGRLANAEFRRQTLGKLRRSDRLPGQCPADDGSRTSRRQSHGPLLAMARFKSRRVDYRKRPRWRARRVRSWSTARRWEGRERRTLAGAAVRAAATGVDRRGRRRTDDLGSRLGGARRLQADLVAEP